MAKEEKAIKPKIKSTKFGAAFLAAWMPMINNVAELGIDSTTLILFIIPLCLYLIVEGTLDALRIIYGRGGPEK